MLASTTMNILKFYGCHRLQPRNTHFSQNIHPISSTTYCKSGLCILSSASTISSCPRFSPSRTGRKMKNVKVSEMGAPLWTQKDDEEENMRSSDDLIMNGDVYQKTLRLVECSMFAALGGLVYILSSSLAIENYFGCFFALPIVFSSMRWDVVAGRKTMVATATLLLVLAGPIKAITYLLMHGFLGLAMGSLWRWQYAQIVSPAWELFVLDLIVFVELYSYVTSMCACALSYIPSFPPNRGVTKTSWSVSILVSALVRAVGAVGYVLMYSFLIRENILALITINIHASATFILSSLGFLAIPSMNVIYTIFGTLLLLNCCFFVFLLHLLYVLFFSRLGMKASLRLPKWFAKAI